ncbi:MAG: hypothetical protein QOG67_8 [Verrucomicrobiota bacterium]|jgi:hypothetical protein
MTFRLLVALATLFICGCAYVGAVQTWNPTRADSDAECDIATGNIRFAYIGGITSYAPGLPDGSYRVVGRYPHLEVGPQGCMQDNDFDVRAAYARRYNARMWKHVSNRIQASNQQMQ